MSQRDTNDRAADLTPYRWTNRLLFLFAESPKGASYQAMRKELDAARAGVADRDLVIFELLEQGKSFADGRAISDSAVEALRERFGVAPGQFAVVLVGKDGTVKRQSGEAVPLREIFEQIDAMPMRQREMRERREEP